MSHEEALVLLNLEKEVDSDEIQDQFENLLFEAKKYFLEKLAIKKLFLPKLKHVENLFLAFQCLNGHIDEKISYKNNIDFTFNDNLLEAFDAYHYYRNQLKQVIVNTSSYAELEHSAIELICLEKKYAEKWSLKDINTENVLISKVPDSILILKAMQNYLESRGATFEDLKNFKNNPSEILLQEMKRLSLLHKTY